MIPMLLAQAAAQAVETGRSGISVFLDAGVIGLILTNSGLLIKALIDRKTIKTALGVAEKAVLAKQTKVKEEEEDDSRLKPGEGPTCRTHGEEIATLKESKANTDKLLLSMDKKIDILIQRNN